MLRSLLLLAVSVPLAAAEGAASLHGQVTDPSGARVPNALVQLIGPGGERRATTDALGNYSFASLAPGKYRVRVIAKGFSVGERRDYEISGPAVLDAQLTIEAETQVVNVDEEASRVSAEPAQNATALVLGQKELAALSDDPYELEQQLQAMAGPSGGPNGGQIYIDGFTGGNLPPKSSIREVRINSNPFSPEYDRPGFGRIEIFTKPGTDSIRGQAFLQWNKEALNSRSPLLAQSQRPPYQQKFAGFSLSGPVRKRKSSFGLDFERRIIGENAFVLATTLDHDLNVESVNQAILTPQTRTTISPRLDVSLTPGNTLTLRYQNTQIDLNNQGVGDFSLASRAYRQTESEHSLQATETAVLSPRTLTETRFQFMRSHLAQTGDNSQPAITVRGAFEGGGAQVGRSGTLTDSWELNNVSTCTRERHTVKWGGRLRQSFLDDTSQNNFGGTFTFFGGTGPALDANNQPIAGTEVQLSALERYRRTLFFLEQGLTAAQIRALGGGASQFSLNTGTATSSVRQLGAGLFVNDDWRLRPNLTLSYGLRYEAQTNLGDRGDWSPRIGLAWGVDGGANKTAKTVLRAGFGAFYDRLKDTETLNAFRFNGRTQQSYLVMNPDFYPTVPSAAALAGGEQPQQLQLLDARLVAPRTYQASIGIDRQVNRSLRLGAQYVASRGVHLLRTWNINAPVDGVYPFGDQELRMLTESTGFSRASQLILSPRVNYKKLSLFGFYALSYGKTDAEGQPADPYNLRAEWGPSTMMDVRHRMVIGTSLPLPWNISLSPFFMASSGSPYNITTGRDANLDGVAAERPALLALSQAQCNGGDLVYRAGFGCFDLNPAPGTAIGRNSARGPANINLSLRLARTWAFGRRGESGSTEGGPPPGMGGVQGGGPPPGGPGGGGPPPGGGPGGGPPPGLFGGDSGKKYNLTLSLMARNVLNHPNYAAPSGDLSSPYFGEYRSLAGFGPFGGNTTYNRKIDVQLRFTF
jgi:hypothetical protein